MRYETKKVLIADLGHYISVSNGQPPADCQTVFPAELIRPCGTQAWSPDPTSTV